MEAQLETCCVSVSNQGEWVLWDSSDGRCLMAKQTDNQVKYFKPHSAKPYLVGYGDSSEIYIVNAATLDTKCILDPEIEGSWICDLDLSESGMLSL